MIKKEFLAARYPARPEPTGVHRFSGNVAAAEGSRACDPRPAGLRLFRNVNIIPEGRFARSVASGRENATLGSSNFQVPQSKTCLSMGTGSALKDGELQGDCLKAVLAAAVVFGRACGAPSTTFSDSRMTPK